MAMGRLAMVADELHAADHGANGEEPKNLCANDTDLRNLLTIGVPDG